MSNQNLEIQRHTLAHIMMQALQRLYQAIPAIGPATEDGFYHDFECEHKIIPEDLPKIEGSSARPRLLGQAQSRKNPTASLAPSAEGKRPLRGHRHHASVVLHS